MSNARISDDHPLPLNSRADVAKLVGIPLNKLTYWLIRLSSGRRYTTFSIPRRGSKGTRVIEAPIKPIKDVQSKLATALQACYRPPAPVHGYVHKRSIRSNAEKHSGKRWVLRIDLEDFFPTINFGRVRGLFMAYPFGYVPDVATLLAQICCHKNRLPHGAPTSPIISNLICRGLDKDLLSLSVHEYCHYSRYCDDLIFSASRKSFPAALATQDDQGSLVAGPEITRLITKHGFRVNSQKTRLCPQAQRQMVTGLVVNRGPNIPREYIRSLRNLLYIWKRYSEADAVVRFQKTQNSRFRPSGKPSPAFRSMIRGRVQYVGQIKGWTDPVYLGLAKTLAYLDDGFREPRIPSSGGTTTLRVLLEGPTDVFHLEAALRWFRGKGLFADLQLTFQAQTGDQELLKAAKVLSGLTQQLPSVCLFDRDKPEILKDVLDDEEKFKHWGNGVFTWALPRPTHRDPKELICIEKLYTDEVLHRREASGRRLYLRSEFDPESGWHFSEQVHCIHPKNRNLIAEEVYKETQRIGLSKSEFARMISAGNPPLDSVSFDGFREIFETLERIQTQWPASQQGTHQI